MSTRPEHIAPPEIYYNDDEAAKYTTNTRVIEIQTRMSRRALELLALPAQSLVLDVGCGSGLSGAVLSDAGHQWLGVDISRAMLDVADDNGAAGDLVELDIGDGVPFRPGAFDGCMSISAVQWLCNADRSSHVPHRRLRVFFQSLFNALARGARAVLQFYPENPAQMEMIVSAAMKVGFTGGLVVDYPNSTRAKKYFLVLFAGPSSVAAMPKARTGNPADDDDDDDGGDGGDGDDDGDGGETRQARFLAGNDTNPARRRERQRHRRGKKPAVKSKDWILAKKERQRAQGKEVRQDSKYTARVRRMGW